MLRPGLRRRLLSLCDAILPLPGTYSQHTSKHLVPFDATETRAAAYIAAKATLVGRVTVGKGSSVYPHCVLRGDLSPITIGENSNLQDGTVVHVRSDRGVSIGDGVTIGHKAMLHGCTVDDDVLVGMNAVLLDGCHIGQGSFVAAGALVTQGKVFEPRSFIMGVPAKCTRKVTDEEWLGIQRQAQKYVTVSIDHAIHEKRLDRAKRVLDLSMYAFLIGMTVTLVEATRRT